MSSGGNGLWHVCQPLHGCMCADSFKPSLSTPTNPYTMLYTHIYLYREAAARRAQLDAEAARRKRMEVLKQIQGVWFMMWCSVLIWFEVGRERALCSVWFCACVTGWVWVWAWASVC